MPLLFLLFIIIPVIEITLFIKVGELIGLGYTIALILLSAFIGVNMLRQQGLSTLSRAQQRLNSGEIPGQEMVEGLVLAVGGALLITPGFFTDVIGFCCLIPWTRRAFVAFIRQRVKVINVPPPMGSAEPFNDRANASHFPPKHNNVRRGEVIDGEYRREEE